MTRAEVDAAVAKNRTIFPETSAMAGNKGPISRFLTGKALTLRDDTGLAVEYRFEGVQTLRWRREGERACHEERYESWESAPGGVRRGRDGGVHAAEVCGITPVGFDEQDTIGIAADGAVKCCLAGKRAALGAVAWSRRV